MEYYVEKGNIIYSYYELIDLVKTYISDERQLKTIQRAYLTAKKMHIGVFRKSGEPYIIHPLNVAYIAATYKLDYETICASLLHDVVEDTAMSLDEISSAFGDRIALLVDGVTKITNMKFNTKDEEQKANANKILHSMCHDIRILFIKLADRLHNMRTMSSMKPKKQIYKSNETSKLYIPLAHRFGLYRLKEELDDIALYYKDQNSYNKTYEIIESKKDEFYEILSYMKNEIYKGLKQYDIENHIELAIKNVASVYRRLNNKIDLENMHDLLALKIIVPEVMQCYTSLGIIHSKFPHTDDGFKDYISNPKPNNYQSLHSVLFSGTPWLVQTRIRTKEMNDFANSGIITYCQNDKNIDDEAIINKLTSEFSIFRELVSTLSYDNIDASGIVVEQEERKIKIYIHSLGYKIEIPYGSTVLDVAFKLGDDYLLHGNGAFVNNRSVNNNFKLNDGDIIKIILDKKCTLKPSMVHQAKTEAARQRIKFLTRRQ